MSVTEISAGEGGSASGHRFADALRQGDGDTLSRWMTSVVLLRQQTLQRFIYDAADSRYSQLRSLLGLGTLDDFEAAARQTKDSLGRRARHASEQLAHVRARLEEREAGLARTQQVSSSGWSDALQTRLKELLQSPSPNIGAQLPERVDAESVARIGRDVSIALEATQEIAAVFPGGEVAQNNLRQALAEAERTVDGATRAVSAAMDAAPWQQLAGAALGLLDDRCPVCEQSIEQNSVRIRLRTVLSRAAADAERLGEAQRVLEAARAEVAHLQVQVDRRQKDEAMWGLARDRWNSQISRLTEISVQAPNERADAEALISVLVDLRQELRMLYLDVSAPASRSEVERIQREVEEVRAAVRVAEIEQLEAERAAASASL
jgi:DNA repair exonuclease SbcCD ATPase subunit